MSSFLSCLVCVCVSGFVLFLHLEDIRVFAFHLFSYNLRIVDRPQRRFDDRLSLERARHELKRNGFRLTGCFEPEAAAILGEAEQVSASVVEAGTMVVDEPTTGVEERCYGTCG